MSAVTKPRKLTAAEYLAIEERAEYKSEFYNGEMFAMAGASTWHNIIKENLSGEFHSRLKGGPCWAVSSDQRLLVADTGLYTYPDLMIICGKAEFDPANAHTITNPTVVVEVLSPSTEAYDRGIKFQHYQKLATVREIVLVEQDRPRADVFARRDDGRWVLSSSEGLAARLALGSVPIEVPMADVYRNIEFPDAPSRPPTA